MDHFCLSIDKRHFLIATNHGKMIYYLIRDGKFEKKLFKHKNLISDIFIDEQNKLISSAGWDGQIIIQKEYKPKKSLYKRLKKANFGKPINIMRI